MISVERWADLPGYVGVFAVSDRGRVRAYGRRPSAYAWEEFPGEIWRAVPAYEGIYEVSDHGRVKSLERTDGRGHWRVAALMKPAPAGPPGKQYLGLKLSHNGVERSVKVHRLVLEAFVGPCPEGMEGCHNDGNKLHNVLENLRWDTPGANGRDKRAHGTDHQVSKTHCPRGHEYTADNVYDETMTNRRCKQCARDRALDQGDPVNPRTHCRNGHEMSPDNVRMSGSARKCRTCENARRKRRYAERTQSS